MRRSRLATIFATRLALILTAAMAVYAVLEWYRNPQRSLTDLGVTHGLHLAILTLLVYLVLVVGFGRLVARPLRAIDAHLYMVATGRLELLHLDARVKEIAEMVGSVNLMVRRMRLGAGDADPHRTALALRDLATGLHDDAPAAAEAMLEAAAALDQLTPSLRGRGPAAPDEVPRGSAAAHPVGAPG